MNEGTFLVTHADADSALLRDVEAEQVITLAESYDLSVGEVVTARLVPEPPLEVAWQVEEITDRYRVTVEESPEPPTSQERAIAEDQAVGDLTREDRAGTGELHVLTVPAEETERAVADVINDEATLARAARTDGVARVEVRAADGVVSVRYLP